MGLVLVHKSGDRTGLVQRPDVERVLIGRDVDSEVVLDDDVVSTHHAEIIQDGKGWVLVDLDSTNGTFVNGESASRQPLTDGDVIRFGKRGPELKVELAANGGANGNGAWGREGGALGDLAAGGIRDRHDRDRDGDRDRDRERDRDRNRDRNRDEPKPKPQPPRQERSVAMGNTAIRAAVDQAVAASQRRFRMALLAIVVLCVGLSTAVVGFFYREGRVRAAAAREAVWAELQEQRHEFERNQATRDKAEREATRQREVELAALRRQLDEAKRAGDDEAHRVEALQKELVTLQTEMKDITTRTARFKQISEDTKSSLVLIFASVQARDSNGGLRTVSGFGSGFIATDAGHIVTNKHVIKPWLYSEAAIQNVQQGMTIDPTTLQLAVWPAGTKFARPGTHQLDFTAAYSTQKGTLKIARTTRDRFTHVVIDGPNGKKQSVRVHAGDHSDDLAILKAEGGPFKPIPLRPEGSVLPETLDAVMVLGFPRGPQMLEMGLAIASPVTGEIRKVEETITVSAPLIKGNSGGPLVDIEGRAIGVCTRVAAGTETLGTCIGIEHVRRLLRNIR